MLQILVEQRIEFGTERSFCYEECVEYLNETNSEQENILKPISSHHQ